MSEGGKGGRGSKGGKGRRRGSMPASDYSGAACCATTAGKSEASAAPTVLFLGESAVPALAGWANLWSASGAGR